MSPVTIRHATPTDVPALTRLYSQPETQTATLQLPYPSPTLWEQKLSNPRAGVHMLVACLDEQVVGQLTLEAMTAARRRHCATLGMGVDPAFPGHWQSSDGGHDRSLRQLATDYAY